MKQVKLLDCTLRDGGYVNDWEFGHDNIVTIFERLISAGVDILEVGFLDDRRTFDRNRTIMPTTQCADQIFGKLDKGNTMIVAMLLLAALCVLIALSASWLAPKIMHIAHAFTNTPPVTVASGIALVPGTFHTRVTPSLLLLLLLAMPLLPGLYWLWCRSRRAAFRRTGDAWACGYGWENAMAPSGNGVMQPLRVVFSALFRLRQQLDPTLRLNKGLAHVTARAQSTDPFWDERVIRPIVSATQRLAKEIQHLQSGDFRLYCLYVVAALVVLLIAIAV